MTSSNRRAHERYSCDMVVWLRPADRDGELFPVEVENVSSGGILCRSSAPLASGTRLELRISILQYEEMVEVRGIVRHLEDRPGGEHAIGIQFTEVANMTVRGFMASLEAMFS